ncbi:MAG TPA: CotH kinase family protein [Ohtaekwangia sp.]
MKRVYHIVLLLLISSPLCAQLTDSNLPIVIINTDGGAAIPNDYRVLGNMKIIDRGAGERNYVSDQNNDGLLNYKGRIEIEIRGSSSTVLDKKQYGFTTLQADNTSNNNVSLLGMPKENDWIFNGLAFDDSLIRDYLSYTLSRILGVYAPRTRYCEVIINGDYRGLYVLQEKIKADDNRVDILKIETSDNTFPDISGGYITKADKVTWDDPSAWQVSSYLGTNDVNFIHEMPKPSEITTQQHQFIKSVFDKLGSTAKTGNSSVSDGYPSVIDVPSFIDFMILNELAANVDAYQFSTFFHKDRNGKLRAGPLWDLNLTYGNDLLRWGLDRSKTNTWQFNNGDNIGARFWKDLFDNSTYRCYMAKRWNELTQIGAPLNLESLKDHIDELVASISEAAARNITRWPPIPDDHPASHPYNYTTEIANMKNFLQARINWMNTNLGSFSSCDDVQTPPLVITKINYNPDTDASFPDSDNQEFIEITNHSDELVSLTGVYFRGTGFVYQFPAGSALPPHGVIQLANDRQTFINRYAFSPFGEFTRKLANSEQKLTLADGFGNVIDEVLYSDEAPWPDADGNGMYLKLIDPDLDNADGTNWVASADPIATTIVGTEKYDEIELELYPNPTEEKIYVEAKSLITSLQVSDIHGRPLETIPVNSTSYWLEMGKYTRGMYLVSIRTSTKTVVEKVIRK